MYCLFCDVLCIVCVYMCTVLLPPGGYPITVKHITRYDRIFLCSSTLSNTSSFLTRSVQLIFSILLQHHILKLPRYLRSTLRTVLVSPLHKSCTPNVALCQLITQISVQSAGANSLHLVEGCFCHDDPRVNFICYHAIQIVEMFHILQLLSF